jgi:hypothetical protein
MRAYLTHHHLADYIYRRSNQEDYQHFYGRWFGDNKSLKLAAAKALQNGGDVTPHKKALSGGELLDIHLLLEACHCSLGAGLRPGI